MQRQSLAELWGSVRLLLMCPAGNTQLVQSPAGGKEMKDEIERHISLTLIWRFVLGSEIVGPNELAHFAQCDKCMEHWWQTKLELGRLPDEVGVRLQEQ